MVGGDYPQSYMNPHASPFPAYQGYSAGFGQPQNPWQGPPPLVEIQPNPYGSSPNAPPPANPYSPPTMNMENQSAPPGQTELPPGFLEAQTQPQALPPGFQAAS